MLSKLPLSPRSAAPLPRRLALALFGLAAVLAVRAEAAAITGVCPDGSMFIVKQESQIPCQAAKVVAPGEMPPIRPEYLPTPYTWQVYNERQDPDNPYNLIDQAREVRALRDAARSQGGSQAEGATPAVSAATPREVAPLDLGLSEPELRDLFLLVELSQEQAPAAFSRETADGRGVFELRLARSRAFEDRLTRAWASRGGLDASGVVLFTALSKRPERFHANLTFIQDHLSYQPQADAPRQLGVLQGRLGELGADELVLGYVVLPAAIDLARPIDVYWNDRRIEARFPN